MSYRGRDSHCRTFSCRRTLTGRSTRWTTWSPSTTWARRLSRRWHRAPPPSLSSTSSTRSPGSSAPSTTSRGTTPRASKSRTSGDFPLCLVLVGWCWISIQKYIQNFIQNCWGRSISFDDSIYSSLYRYDSLSKFSNSREKACTNIRKNFPTNYLWSAWRSLYEHGGDALSRQFAEVVKKHSRPVPATDILNSIAVDDELGVSGELSTEYAFLRIRRVYQLWMFELFLSRTRRNRNSIVSGSGPASNVTANTAGSGGSKDQVDFVSIHHFPEEIQTDLIQVSSVVFGQIPSPAEADLMGFIETSLWCSLAQFARPNLHRSPSGLTSTSTTSSWTSTPRLASNYRM